MHSDSALRKGFLWNTAGNLVYMLCQYAFSILVLRLAGETGSGLFNLAQSYTNIFLTVASYGMYSFQVSDARDKYPQYCYIQSRVATVSLATAMCACSIALGALALGYSVEQCACILLYHGYRMVESSTDVFNAIEQKHMRLDIVGKTYALRGVVSLAIFMAALAATHDVALTLTLMLSANLVLFIGFTLPRARPFYKREYAGRRALAALLTECLPLVVYSALNTTAASLPKILMEQVLGGDKLGIYGPVTAPVLMLQVGASYLFTPFITVFSQSYADRDAHRFWDAVLSVQGIVTALLPVGWLVAHFLGGWGLSVFVGQGSEAYQYLLAPMVVSAVLTAMVLFYSMVLTVMRCMRGLIFANVLGIAAAALISRPFMLRWDMQGATFASIAALLVQAACLGFVLVRRARRHFSAGPHRPAQEPDGLPSDAADTLE